MSTNSPFYDLLIVGAGPCGLACGIEAARHGLSYLILDKGSITDAVRRYPVNGHFFSTADKLEIGGLPFPAIHARPTRTEALQYYRRVSEYFDLNLKLYTEVKAIDKTSDGFKVHTHTGVVYHARYVAIATGYYDQPRPLSIEGGTLPHVHRYYDEPFRYAHTATTILGGGNSAIETALDLYRNGVGHLRVFVLEDDFVPTAKYWLIPDMRNRVKDGSIEVHFRAECIKITPSEVVVRHHLTGEVKSYPTDFVLALIGYRPDAELMRDAGIELEGPMLIPKIDATTYETNVPDLYVVGSVVGGEETAKVFIENGRYHGAAAVADILRKQNAQPHVSAKQHVST
ncbi:thioredoxin reductase (NADPH) [Catalinimonas alkaloidigena]|uniref:Thioredoxin reductase (NADPH) n=1 Tax=Catalinimonas alkaloidigena TaxID=1075417 RepID=A0A1G9MJR3_9BACT|nr:YpdA family putative bacillithiol disulfide reductase [Catalinimonas alkaloidigena]SDL74508.1 thioredoxin reductase (NADPH) [Catalinimonas alkaloidigena]